MKAVISVIISTIILMAAMFSIANAHDDAQSGIVSAGPAVILVASRKKRTGGTGGQSTTDRYVEAMELCRQKYGRSNVIRVRIHSDGSVTCYIQFYSPSKGKTNFRSSKP